MRAIQRAAVAVSLLSFANAAWSADLSPPPPPPLAGQPYKAPPYVERIFDWSGLYFGGHGGAGWFKGGQYNISGLGAPNNLSGNGWLAGAQFGYNYQLGSWVIGIEGDFTYSDLRGSATNPLLAPAEQTVRINWFASAAARFGIAWDRTLVYAKGGFAYADVRSEVLIPLVVLAVANDSRTGWTAGVGAEWAFMDNWTAKVEYNYLDLGTRTVTMTTSTGATATADSKAAAHMIKLGANYRFTWR